LLASEDKEMDVVKHYCQEKKLKIWQTEEPIEYTLNST